MKPVKTTLAAAALAALSGVALAGTTLTFEGLGNGVPVDGSYAASGISFSPSALAYTSVTETDAGAQFAHAPSGVSAATIINGNNEFGSFRIDLANGFQNSFSLWFAGVDFDSTVRLFGRDANGKDVLRSDLNMTLAAGSANDDICPVTVNWSANKELALCQWHFQEVKGFTGSIYAIEISGPTGLMFFDDLSFGSASTQPGNNVPEPGSLALLMAAGIGAAAITRRRKPQA